MIVKYRIIESSDSVFKTDNGSHWQTSLYSLPRNLVLRRSKHCSDFYGIWSREDIPIGTRFGPYEEKQVSKVTNREKLNDILSNWLQYIRSAHSEQHQNLVMFRCQEQIFCVSCQHIPSNSELLIGYKNERECSWIGVANNNIKLYEVSYEKILGLHYGEKLSDCDACIKTTWLMRQLNILDVFHSRSSHKDSECGKRSTNSEISQQALSGEKFYKCDDCGEKFTRDVDLKIHKRGHTHKKFYECEKPGVICEHNNLNGFSDSLFKTDDGSYWQTSLHSLPENLAIRQSIHYSDIYGIWSQEDIPEGTRFGPYEETLVVKVMNGKIQNNILSSWFQYIRLAYGEQQQNLAMFSCKDQIFCVSCMPIPANTELLVGYKRAYPWIDVVDNNIKLYEVCYEKIHHCEKLKECDKCIKTVWWMRQLTIPDVFHNRNNHRNYNEYDNKYAECMPTNSETCRKVFCDSNTHKCDDCGKKFQYRSNLELHKRVHTGARHFLHGRKPLHNSQFLTACQDM